jgi:hypothetical protein
MRILSVAILASAAALSTAALAKDPQPKPHAAPASVERAAAYDFTGYSAQGDYGLKPRLDHRPLGGEEFQPGVANGS